MGPLLPSGKGRSVINSVISSEEAVELNDTLVNMIKNKKICHISLGNIRNIIESLILPRANNVCYTAPCGAGNNFLVIDALGSYRTCDCIYHDYFLLGNDNNTDYLFNNRASVLDRLEYMKNNDCSNCAIFGLCGGGCIAEAIAYNGTEKSIPKINCMTKKHLYKMFLKELAFDKKRTLFTYWSNINDREMAR